MGSPSALLVDGGVDLAVEDSDPVGTVAEPDGLDDLVRLRVDPHIRLQELMPPAGIEPAHAV